MTDTCINHPQNAAVEQCEVCSKPLCGLCLWYTGHGHRLCADHARDREKAGETVLPPHTYQEAFAAGVVAKREPARLNPNQPVSPAGSKIYTGNNNDIVALIALVMGLVTLASCFGGAYCLPILGIVLAATAYFNAEQAVDPKRTRRLAIAGLGASLAIFVILAAIVFFYLFVIFLAVGAGSAVP